MAVPKSKISRSRRGHRRAHTRVSAGHAAVCKNCGELARRHQLCPHCGYYNGREVLLQVQE